MRCRQLQFACAAIPDLLRHRSSTRDSECRSGWDSRRDIQRLPGSGVVSAFSVSRLYSHRSEGRPSLRPHDLRSEGTHTPRALEASGCHRESGSPRPSLATQRLGKNRVRPQGMAAIPCRRGHISSNGVPPQPRRALQRLRPHHIPHLPDAPGLDRLGNLLAAASASRTLEEPNSECRLLVERRQPGVPACTR
jgi:hypothetical protein